MYTSVDIAGGFLSIVQKGDSSVSKTKLIKLCYIAHGCHLAVTGKNLFIDKIEAWQYGPVMPLLYGVLCLDFKTIDRFYKSQDIDSNVEDLIKFIWNIYKDFNATQLVEMTHKKGTPWHQVYDEYERKEIPADAIKNYYKKFLKV